MRPTPHEAVRRGLRRPPLRAFLAMGASLLIAELPGVQMGLTSVTVIIIGGGVMGLAYLALLWYGRRRREQRSSLLVQPGPN